MYIYILTSVLNIFYDINIQHILNTYIIIYLKSL